MPKRILIIEDDADIRRGLSLQLQARGYTTDVAADAITGQSAAVKTSPALILLDLGLPGADGLMLLKRFKTLSTVASVPVIVLTGRDPAKYEQESLAAGAVAFFQKPPEIERLVSAIREQIGEAGTQTEQATAVQPKILLIEDDAVTRLSLSVQLRKAGYATAFAADATTALTVAQREKPNLVLLDLGLPGGDGFMVLQRMKSAAALASTPVIVLSGHESDADRTRALDTGACAYFRKPAEMPALLAAIQEQLGR